MALNLSLAQKLTASIAIAVAIQITLVIGSYFLYFEPRLEHTTIEVVNAGVLANAQTYATKWSYEILLTSDEKSDRTMNPALQQNIQQVLKENKNIAGISIFRPGSDTGAERERNNRVAFRLVAHKSQPEANFSINRNRLGTMNKVVSWVAGDNAYAGIPVKVEADVVGYLVFSRSIRSYYDEMRFFKFGVAGVMFLFFIMQLAVVFILSARTGRPVSLLAETTAQIAAGDLTRSVQVEKHAVSEIQALSSAILNMATAIHQQVSLIKSLTIKTSGVSSNLARAMSQLTGSASEQAAAVSQTATTVEEMESTGKNVVEAAKRIVEAAERSAEVSSRGRHAVSTASGVMTKIKEDSVNVAAQSRMLLANVEEVGNIINSVNSISEQSKILAVNASIEAAKAGEFGSGFAVVAQEVKNLAGQSREATEQITHTLTSIRHSVEMMVRLSKAGEDRTVQGVTSIANAGAIVNDLSDAIQEASEMANEIESSVNQQSMGLSQIASAMDEINISASENQKISHKMERGTLEITAALKELNMLVDIWTTADDVAGQNDAR